MTLLKALNQLRWGSLSTRNAKLICRPNPQNDYRRPEWARRLFEKKICDGHDHGKTQ